MVAFDSTWTCTNAALRCWTTLLTPLFAARCPSTCSTAVQVDDLQVPHFDVSDYAGCGMTDHRTCIHASGPRLTKRQHSDCNERQNARAAGLLPVLL